MVLHNTGHALSLSELLHDQLTLLLCLLIIDSAQGLREVLYLFNHYKTLTPVYVLKCCVVAWWWASNDRSAEARVHFNFYHYFLS